MRRQLSDFDYMLEDYQPNVQYLTDLRKQFVDSYPLYYVANKMKLDNYVVGKSGSTFCQRLEFELPGLGSARGSTSEKYGIYFMKQEKHYWIKKVWQTPKNHPDPHLSFMKLRKSLGELLRLGAIGDEQAIQKIPIAPMVKMKILSVYYPKKYLNIFSERPLNYFLFQFYGNDFPKKASRFEKQTLLIKIKKSNKSTANWDNIKFGNYLYHLFPEAAKLGRENQVNGRKNYDKILFKQVTPVLSKKNGDQKPKDPIAYDKQAVPFQQKRFRKVETTKKTDYLTKQKENSRVGDKGEQIVIAYEKERLKYCGDLAQKVVWMSQKSDAKGYDVLSYEKDGTERQIEVKSTTDKVSDKFKFILTENEREHAEALSNYWIYRVFDIDNQPVIYKIKNPFKNNLVHMKPLRYQAVIKVKDIKK